MKKMIFIIIFALSILIVSNLSNAQVTQLTIGVDGFTCSLCAKGVEGELKSLDFVKSVKTNLKDTKFTLTFKQNQRVNISMISDAVYDGGFSVRDINVVAKGSLKGDASSGYKLVAPNTPEINLDNINDNFGNGDNIELKGKVNTVTNTINVTSIRRL